MGVTASFIAGGIATPLGALPVFLMKTIRDRTRHILLGFGAGVMLAAVSFSLIVPGLQSVLAGGGSKVEGALIVGMGIILGALAFHLADRYAPHEHFFAGREGSLLGGGDGDWVRRVWLFVIAITIHNFPEGLSVGVAFGGGESPTALALAIGIGAQNIPEGLVVAVSLVALGYKPGLALGVALLSGMVEPLGALVGAGAVALSLVLLPWFLGFAAGAMLFVISDEIIPETHRLGKERPATFGLMIGFILMMTLDTALG
ncbi:MAG: ZIP family metal transporter [Alphaproteobacteria bacterium CG_4_10_14_0_2_um_filter_63_37]|nr:MAG: ZIP family metal transporter [Proteobacteria bacterium CG1_02_64_396]PJA24087.1 MAG: ZIP family metal transporter [Alphaproteobacteria bacterium CG_4_10_14_0_2_um_filter_63_37]